MNSMPYRWKTVAVSTLAILLNACSTAGGPILGLPIAAPKNLKGTVSNSTYVSPDQRFSVALPYDESTDQWKYMMVREGNDGDNLQYVIFGPVYGPSVGPMVVDMDVYHVVYVRKRGDRKFSSDFARAIFLQYNQQAEQRYKKPVNEVVVRELTINNRQAVFGVYKQSFPIGKSRLLKTTRHYAYCVLDLGDHIANVMVEMASEHNERADAREAALTAGTPSRLDRLTRTVSGYSRHMSE